MTKLGIYGKLPCKGDFINRSVPNEFVSQWDAWLQQALETTQQQLGANWLKEYIEAPLWYFVFPSGVIGQHAWIGACAPSVDRVGRYFPVTLVYALPEYIDCLQMYANNQHWLVGLTNLIREALNPQLVLEEFEQRLQQFPSPFTSNEPSNLLPAYQKLSAQMTPKHCLWGCLYGQPEQHWLLASLGLPAAEDCHALLDLQFSSNWIGTSIQTRSEFSFA